MISWAKRSPDPTANDLRNAAEDYLLLCGGHDRSILHYEGIPPLDGSP